MKDLSLQQKDDLPAALKQLQLESSYSKPAKGQNFRREVTAAHIRVVILTSILLFVVQINRGMPPPRGRR